MRKNMWKELETIDKFRKNKIHLKAASVGRKDGDRYIYQYRNMESFWAIVESDSFWATNARFSNDQEEQRLGMKKVQEVFNMDGQASQLFEDCYIVCFCEHDDKLSQWRGYAPEGVSIGFDFNSIQSFYIKATNEDRFLHLYNSCYKVQYIDVATNKDELEEIFDLNTIDDKNVLDDFKRQAKEIIPYIKHRGFYEEAESRLVFSNGNGDLSQYIHYRNVFGVKVPYIVVKMGDIEANKNDICVIRINIEHKKGIDLQEKLQEFLSDRKIKKVKVICCTDEKETDDSLCYGCTLRETYIPGVNGTKAKCRYARKKSENFCIDVLNEIYISDSKEQEKVCNCVYDFLFDYDSEKKIKVWCEGHLPIRHITVGNLHNKEVVKESIKHYCEQHYWLRSVEVECSKSPYRSSLL